MTPQLETDKILTIINGACTSRDQSILYLMMSVSVIIKFSVSNVQLFTHSFSYSGATNSVFSATAIPGFVLPYIKMIPGNSTHTG